MRSLPRHLALLSTVCLSAVLNAQTDNSVVDRIRDEGLNHSQVVQTLSYLSDVIGPRLTGSPSLKRANEWTRDQMTQWGLSNAHLEKWGPFGRGWQLDRFSAQVISPQDIPLIAYPKAWSPAVHGVADVVLVDVTDLAGLEKFKGKLKGKIVLSGGERPIPARFTAQGTRYTDEQLLAMTQPQAPRPRGNGGGGPQGNPNAANARAQAALAGEKLRFYMQEGVLAVLDESRGDDGTIYVQSAAVPPPVPAPAAATTGAPAGAPAAPPRRGPSVWDASAPKTLPQITVAGEHYNRMVRMINQGVHLGKRVAGQHPLGEPLYG